MPEMLNYVRLGNGIPFFLLHGYPLDHQIWLPVAERMQIHAEIILPDLRGHGKSPAPEGLYSMSEMAEDIRLLMDGLSINKAVIAGHSMGGYVALDFARTYPDRLLGFALVASHAFADTPEKKKSRLDDLKRIDHMTPKELLLDMPGKLSRDPEIAAVCAKLIEKMNPQGLKGILGGMAERLDAMDVLQNLDVPAVVIAGADDQFIPIETSRGMANQMKTPWIVEIPDTGHMLMLEKPDMVADALIALIPKINQKET